MQQIGSQRFVRLILMLIITYPELFEIRNSLKKTWGKKLSGVEWSRAEWSHGMDRVMEWRLYCRIEL